MKTILDTQSSKDNPTNKKLLFMVSATAIALVLALVNLLPNTSAATIDAKKLTIGIVKKGNLISDVRAPGNLIANERLWLSARSDARVVKRVLEPGARVDNNSVILILESAGLVQQFKTKKIDLKVAVAQLDALKEQQKIELQQQLSEVTLLTIEKQQTIQDKRAKQKLRADKIIPEYQFKEAELKTERLTHELEIAEFKLKQLPGLQKSLLRVEQAKVEQQQLQVNLLSEQVESLNVRASMKGILQSISVEEGQSVTQGAELARVASQNNLKAELRIQEGQVRDILLGQKVTIDTRRSKIEGRVSRISPAVIDGTVTVDVELPAELPAEARPDLRVEGIVEISRFENVLLIDKPVNWKNSGSHFIYKLSGDSLVVKTPVVFGASSVSSVQVLSGLAEGERIILSDMSQFASSPQLSIY